MFSCCFALIKQSFRIVENMEIISAYQLQAYEEILEQISAEFERSEKLKKDVGLQNDKILALKLSALPSKQQLSHIKVKIFNTISEICNLYGGDLKQSDLEALKKFDLCKYYLVEMYLPKSLVQKLIGDPNIESLWKIQISVVAESFTSYSVISLAANKIPLFSVIPVNQDVRECVVETCLFLPSEDDHWNVIDLSTVNVDISYHFQTRHKDVKNEIRSLSDRLVDVAKLYTNNFADLAMEQKKSQLQTQFEYNSTKLKFIDSILKNSYHRLDLENFTEINNDKKQSIEFQLFVDNCKVAFSYNKLNNILKLKCNFQLAILLRRFFLQFSNNGKILKKMRDINQKNSSLVEDMDDDPSVDDLINIYNHLRKLF